MKADEKARAFFLQGENVVMAYDSYNGLRLWKRNIPGAMRTGVSSNPSNLALNRDGLFLALQDKCFRLDVATGQTKQTYHLPEGGDKKSAAWGFVACVGNMLYGTPNIGRASNSVFAMDIESGDLRWTYTGKQISVPSISIADGRLFLVDRNITNEQRQTALTEKIAEIEKLKGVLFQADLGTMYEKSERVAQMAQLLAAAVDPVPGTDAAELKKQVARAARLSKSDLVSQVVGEFPKLQGVMGRIYAAVAGEPPAVAAAVEEHYRPLYSGAELPQSLTGAIVSIADKMDSICGCFHVGLIPTGASDPYALRRQGIGIIQIMKQRRFSFSLRGCIEDSARLFDEKNGAINQELAEKVYDFLKNRISHLLVEDGFSKDVVAAVISVSVDDVPGVWQRVAALESLKDRPDFEPLAVAFKRVVNIIKKSGSRQVDGEPTNVDPRLFEDDSEAELLEACQTVEKKVLTAMGKGLFDEALVAVASLRNFVDRFFDAVMVMAEDRDIRRNRLALLGQIASLFGKLADFSKLST
jgi:glycyl-tRNA synthetase beta chain